MNRSTVFGSTRTQQPSADQWLNSASQVWDHNIRLGPTVLVFVVLIFGIWLGRKRASG